MQGVAVENSPESAHNRELLELALVGARAGVWAWDIHSGEVRWSGGLEQIHGLEPGDFGGTVQDVLAEVHPDDLAGVQEAIRRALEDDEPYTVRYRIVRPDGRLAWLEANGRVRRDARGRPLSMAGVCMDVSDRRRLEEERGASEERYRRIVESLPFATYLSDFDTNEALYISPQHAELTGREPAWFLGPGSLDRYRSLVHADDRERITRAREEWAAAGGVGEYRTEHRIVRADGELRYVDSSAFRIGRDPHGRELVQGFLVDVTERRRLDQALRKSEERFRRMVEMAPHGIALLDLDGLVVDVNPAVERLLGYPREEIIGRPCEPFTHPDDHPRESPLLDATRAGARDGYALEKRYLRKDGSSVWANLALTLIRDEHGAPNQLLALIEDISERKRARIALEESETRLRLISEQLPAIVWTTDCELKITSVSGTLNRELMEPRFGDITGTLIGERDVTPEEFADAHLRVIASGAAEALEFIWLGRALEARIEPLVIADEIAGTVGLAIDRSEQREIERRMQQAAQLQALGRLARGIAHDFNNLLASIQVAADLAHERVQDEQARAELDVARSSVAQGAEMVRQLLAFGRQQPVEQRPVDLDELIDQTEPVLARLIDEQRIALERRREGEAVVVVADPSQMSQVVFNLVANARDAIEDEGRITIQTGIVELDLARAGELDLEPGRFGKLTVSDTGAGMDAETMARVFEPFFTTKPQGKGTGLGLATVYGIVAQAGGAVELASEPRQGSTFTVLLPVAEAAERVPVAENGAGRAAVDHPTILLVEDEPGVRVLTSRLLERRGYPYFAAENGEAALALLVGVEQPIDLLLTDVRMPRLGGGDLARQLRAQNPRLPVILMSGDIRDEADLEGLDASRTAFLAKPFTVAELERTIAALLEPSALLGG